MPDFPDAETLLERAREATGLSDFGDPAFREGLDVIVETYATTARLSDKGVDRQARYLVEQLSLRLRCIDALARHPEIREREIRKPMLLTGLPRSGTSALFNLLGKDPAARPLLLWEATAPEPLEGHDPSQPDPRYLALKKVFAEQREKAPDFKKVHYTDADTPEECVLLLSSSFESAFYGIEVLLEPYGSWVLSRDLRPSYRYYLDILRMLDWQRPGERWLLKSPFHLFALDAITELVPDACILMSHRNPVEAVASYCSMMDVVRRMRGMGEQPHFGETVLEYLAGKIERGLAARDRNPERFVDIRFADFVDDNMAVVRGIYEQFDLPLTPEARKAMEEHVARNPQGKHGTHEYGLEQYGLSPERVRERLAGYIERFDLASD